MESSIADLRNLNQDVKELQEKDAEREENVNKISDLLLGGNFLIKSSNS